MKILNVIGSVDTRNGGTTDHVFSNSRIWASQGHQCHILCLDSPESTYIDQAPVTTFAIGPQARFYDFVSKAVPILRYGYTPKLTRWLSKNALSYDAIILNGLWNYTSYGSWRALRKLNVPYYVCPHGMLDPWLKKASPVRHLLRMIFWGVCERNVLRDARGIFFASDEERQLARQSFLPGKLTTYVAGYGTEDVSGDRGVQKSAFTSMFPQLQNRKTILFLGRIHPKKGLDLLIRAFARLADRFPRYDLVIAGPDNVDLKQKLASLGAELGVAERIHWTGMLKGDEKWGAFRSSEFFVLPSHQENFGIAVVEALAVSLPVLVTRQVNIWREIESSGAGFAVANNVNDIAEGLERFFAMPEPQRQAMAKCARSCFLRQFDLGKNAAAVIDLMTELGGRHS